MINKRHKFIIFAFLLAFACIFFPCLQTERFSYAASVPAVSGNKIVLTGIKDVSQEHYFVDDNNESTLKNAEVDNPNSQEYYAIESVRPGEVSGKAAVCFTSDMQPFIEKGLLYAQATVSVSSRYGSPVTIRMSYGEEVVETSGLGELKTDMVAVNDFNTNLEFYFEGIASNVRDFHLEMPTIHLYTKIESVTLNTESQEVAPGQMIKIDASNDVLDIAGYSGNFLRFSKINHSINFEFSQGEDLVDIVDGKFLISNEAKTGDEIIFRVWSNKTSYSNAQQDRAWSDSITLTVNSEKTSELKVFTDFENPAKVSCSPSGKRIGLNITNIQENFEFVGWYLNGEFYSKKYRISIDYQPNLNIYARFIKTIFIESIEISKIYDGTTIIEQNDVKNVVFSGVEKGHDLGLEGVTYSFKNPDAEENKTVEAEFAQVALTGDKKDIYHLSMDYFPTIDGKITKRAVTVHVKEATKQYGDTDPDFSIDSVDNIVKDESLSGMPGREEGEAVGEYFFSAGELAEKNKNYEISVSDDKKFSITQRVLRLQFSVKDKVYDGTDVAIIESTVSNVVNDEEVYAIVSGKYSTANAGKDIPVSITGAELGGKDKENYTLEEITEDTFEADIDKKPLTVTAKNQTFEYGQKLQFDYDVDGLVPFDILTGELSISDKNVGDHEIQLGTLGNANYEISFESAICTITPKDLFVTADENKKFYGDEDPELTYSTQGLVEGDILYGSLERVPADKEEIGDYDIVQGSLHNDNYNIHFTPNKFHIKQREITVNIKFLDREYDGTTNVEWEVEFENNLPEEDIIFDLTAHLLSKDCGMVAVEIDSKSLECDNENSYIFTYNIENNEIEITARTVTVFVDDLSKSYGGIDPEITYKANNVVAGEEIFFEITRKPGEDVGEYLYQFKETQKNANYNIVFVDSNFVIKPKEVEVVIEEISKIYGDEDPDFGDKFEVTGSFAFDDTKESVIDGKLQRLSGEKVGFYDYDLTLSSNPNYVFVNANNASFSIESRPVKVTTYDTTKEYGDEDPDLQQYFSVEGCLEGESLKIKISREPGQDVGEYVYNWSWATTDLSYKVVEFNAAKLTITPCEIGIKADKKEKFYGDQDPTLTVTIVSGFLKNNDSLDKIFEGSLIRENKYNENVGTYAIEIGSLKTNKNYKIVQFEGSELEIIPRPITISAVEMSKVYGGKDPELLYELSTPLFFSDKFEGKLERVEGEDVGAYTISQGTLSLSGNYKIVDFIENDFHINPKEITVIPINAVTEYGEKIQNIEYKVQEELVREDKLEGKLYTNVDDVERLKVGKYRIYSNLSHKNYTVIFGEWYYEISPRVLTIQAEDKIINYGQSDPIFTYDILSGTLLEGDSISGRLSRIDGNSAGKYEIINELQVNPNYYIDYIKGTLTIRPLDITIKVEDYQKVYGQGEPLFEYKIIDGQLINNDVLYGSIFREPGEEVGTYDLINGFYHTNYNITMLPAHLEILKKDVKLITSINDKTFDGTTKATLRNPYISGTVDEVYLNYDKNNCAEFISAQVGKNIRVVLHDITLGGDKASNYNLILPDDLCADITLGQVEQSGVIVATGEPVLYEDYSLKIKSNLFDKKLTKMDNHNFILSYNIWLETENGEQVDLKNSFSIKITLPQKIYKKNNLYVYKKIGDGLYEMVSSYKDEDGNIIINSSLGEFYIAIEDDAWIKYAFFVSIGIVAFFGSLIAIIWWKKRKKNKIKNS